MAKINLCVSILNNVNYPDFELKYSLNNTKSEPIFGASQAHRLVRMYIARLPDAHFASSNIPGSSK